MMTKDQYGDQFTKWDSLMLFHCQEAQVPFFWLKAICMNESELGLHPRVARGLVCPSDIEGSKSMDGKSWGLVQLEPASARDFDLIATPEKLNNPEYSIKIGSQLLKRLYRALNGEEEFVIKAWNEGQGNAVLEKAGRIDGYAAEYWDQYLKNKAMLT